MGMKTQVSTTFTRFLAKHNHILKQFKKDPILKMIIAWQNSGTPIQRFNMLMTKTNGQKSLIWTRLKLTSSFKCNTTKKRNTLKLTFL